MSQHKIPRDTPKGNDYRKKIPRTFNLVNTKAVPPGAGVVFSDGKEYRVHQDGSLRRK